MPQLLDSICGVIKNFRVVDDTSTTLIHPIPCGMTRTFHSSAEMNACESKSALIYDNNSSSTTGYNCMEYNYRFGLALEYCDRFELNGSSLMTSNSLELGYQDLSGDVRFNQGR